MGTHRVQFQLRWVMAVVAAVAVLMSVPAVALEFFALYLTVLSALIFVPASVAPRERRIDTAYWSLALHPLAFLMWLSAWCLLGNQVRLYPKDKCLVNTLLLDTPYALAYLSRFYLPILAALGWALAALYFRRPSVTKPLLVLPIVWTLTVVVLIWDPFDLREWFWD